LRCLPSPTDPDLLSGFAHGADAAVYRLSDELALVKTVDYITPIVDDPFAFGAIAAANALSDIYAVGARPVLALNLVGFPVKTLPLSMLDEILAGGAAKLAEAGVALGGGHSIEDFEPKYGLSVRHRASGSHGHQRRRAARRRAGAHQAVGPGHHHDRH